MNSLLDSFLESASFPAVVVGPDRKISRFNRHFLEMTGVTKETLGKNPSLEFIDQCRYTGDQSQSSINDSNRRPLYKIENVNGETLFYRVQEIPFVESGLEHSLVLFSNETENTRLRDENQHMARLASAGELVSSVVHEIGNCTAIIRGCAELMEMNQSLDENTHEAAGQIKSESDRISEVINGFLGFTRKDDKDIQTFSTEDLVASALELKKYSLRRKGIVYHIDLDLSEDSQLMISGNKTLLMQVLLNLIGNSEEAVHESQKKEINVKLGRRGANVEIEFSDSGKGIPDKSRNKIFDSFYTTKRAGSGTGLGLSISRRIVRNHNGDLVLEKQSRHGGATFVITLPLQADDQAGEGAARQEGTA